MFVIKDNNEINITRGNTGIIEISAENYTFKIGDVLSFYIKNSRQSKEYLLEKKVQVAEEKEVIEVKIEKSDTKDLVCGNYVYGVKINFANQEIDTFIYNVKFKILED